MTARQNRVFVVLKLPGPAPALMARARAIIEACSNHTRLKNPVPSMAELTALVDRLAAAQTDVQLGGKGKREARDAVAVRLREGLRKLAMCVEGQANLDVEQAESFIRQALMSPRAPSTRRKVAFTATPGPVPGSVVVEVLSAGRNALYKWMVSFDGGKTWTVVKMTKQSKTTLEGLPVGKTVQLRCQYQAGDDVPHLTAVIELLVK